MFPEFYVPKDLYDQYSVFWNYITVLYYQGSLVPRFHSQATLPLQGPIFPRL